MHEALIGGPSLHAGHMGWGCGVWAGHAPYAAAGADNGGTR